MATADQLIAAINITKRSATGAAYYKGAHGRTLLINPDPGRSARPPRRRRRRRPACTRQRQMHTERPPHQQGLGNKACILLGQDYHTGLQHRRAPLLPTPTVQGTPPQIICGGERGPYPTDVFSTSSLQKDKTDKSGRRDYVPARARGLPTPRSCVGGRGPRRAGDARGHRPGDRQPPWARRQWALLEQLF